MIVVSQLVKAFVRFGSMVIMARLLSPHDYGVFGMAAVAYGFFQVGRDPGLTAMGVQRLTLEPKVADALFWLLLGAGLLQAGLMMGTGVALARFYHEPQLTPLLAALAGALILANLGAQFRVHLLRALRYPIVALIEVSALLGATALALIAASRAFGHWALVVLIFSQELLTTLGLVFAAHWRPGRWPGRAHARGLLDLAAGAAGAGYANYAILFYDQFFIGRWFGPAALGLYGRAGQLATLPGSVFFGPLTGWMMHALSRLRDHPDEFRAFYRRVVCGLMHACCPLAALLMAAPESFLGWLLGPSWVPTAPLLRALALGLFVLPFSFADVWVLMAMGASRRLLSWSMVKLAGLLLALIIARPGGLVAVAWTAAGAGLALNLASCAVIASVSPLRCGDFLTTTWRPVLLGAALGLALTTALKLGTPPAAAICIGGVLYAAIVWLWPSARSGVGELLALARTRRA